MEKLKRILKVIAGVILVPVFLACFMVDRFIIVFLPWVDSKNMMGWFRDNRQILNSVIRVVFSLICYGIYSLIF